MVSKDMTRKKLIDFERAMEISKRMDEEYVSQKEIDEYEKAMGYRLFR